MMMDDDDDVDGGGRAKEGKGAMDRKRKGTPGKACKGGRADGACRDEGGGGLQKPTLKTPE